MGIKLTASLIVCSLIVSAVIPAKLYTLNKDGISMEIELSSKTSKIRFSVPYKSVDKSFVFHLKTENGECPGYAYWFSKDSVKLPALTVASGCVPGESEIKIRYELGKDFGTRKTDSVDGDTYNFEGQIFYDEDISNFQLNDYKKIRIIRTSTSGARTDQTYDV